MLTLTAIACALAPAQAAPLTAADKAWIAKCVADRAHGVKAGAARLRKYCVCIHEVVENNEPFGITEFERSYPPVHQRCWTKYRLKPN